LAVVRERRPGNPAKPTPKEKNPLAATPEKGKPVREPRQASGPAQNGFPGLLSPAPKGFFGLGDGQG